MDLRLANINDLSKLKAMYENIIDDMIRNNIPIWDEIYPCEFFSDDIKNNRLYLLVEEHDDIVAAFALCESNAGESYMKWGNAHNKALYLDRFGVNVDYSRRGIGSIMLKHAIALTKQKNAKYLRLFVVDINKPAVNMYLKNGFRQIDGIYEERIDDNLILCEYGFEIEV
ncbi:MAG: GNAT family N-acetyltransferase [Clostridium sp.]|jgi:ribosomal protein S18 acetylase RimI-like enzyme|uniref:GNAT family N-acetyltransferase n=1 Tax=Clostridium sp. TaxID=1506 RepID=UPI0025C46B18|nr:GNAT family N-acetyltransferase [Clostridium sp.]MCH3963259.1 GNAT family N-acetyltransferase [Clostridium sp.]MCI1717231.1 GNAT family N-acetyltransferase [Clostridium sp.]MCI1801571.1 GNAT family N-acetyltransferase [Clostridium sp.]MCI1815417.1 GNAT family N-acetyltransferase [Clostridium sp.]MCI1872320.1 GNAT family N-acetyltransferase [Clostridium sp.]